MKVEGLKLDLLGPKTLKKWKTEELMERNNTVQSPLTGKVWIDFCHLSYRMVGVIQ